METDRWPGGCFLDSFDEPPPSEVENKVRKIVQKQTETRITLNSQFEQHRDFQDAGELRSLPASSAGLHSVKELHSIHQEAQHLASLSRAGMNDREVSLFLQAGQPSTKMCEPEALRKRLQELRERLTRSQDPEDVQQKPAAHCHPPPAVAMDCKLPEDPFTYIAEFAKRLDARRKRRKRDKPVNVIQDVDVAKETEEQDARQVDASLWHAIVPLEDEDILTNRLGEEDIRKIPRFAGYAPGEPHSVLYLKNLHPKTSQEELIAIFSRYDKPEAHVKYRMMTGRMRGQAFVQFSNVETATCAFRLANGYQLRGRPIIITYGKQKKEAL